MKILMVLTSHDQLGDTGNKTGFWLEEFVAPYYLLNDAGADITLASPAGGQPPIDPKSDSPDAQSDDTRRFKDDAEASFLRPASEQLAGGYVIYGPQCCLVVTFGKGTLMFVLDPSAGRFELVNDGMQTPGTSKEYAINASNHRHWDPAIRAYIEDCQAGKTGPHGQDSNMRWVASLVAETHRILTRGGIFLYPGDARPGYEMGRLRMVYEVAPIAFLIEQAGGLATDGRTPIMEQAADALHARSPLVFGSPDKVRQVAGYYDRAV